MITEIELLQHKIETLNKESQSLKKNHEWGEWDNWREFTGLDIKILDLKMELLHKEKQHLKQAIQDYNEY